MKQGTWSFSTVLAVLLFALCLQTGIAFFAGSVWLAASAVLTAAAALYSALHLRYIQRGIRRYVAKLSENLEAAGSQVLQGFSIPVLAAGGKDEMIWYNEAFRSGVTNGQDIFGRPLTDLIDAEALQTLKDNRHAEIALGDKLFTTYYSVSGGEKDAISVFYFIDETQLRHTAEEYAQSRPAVAYITIDGDGEIAKGVRDNARAARLLEAEKEIEAYFSGSGLLCRLSSSLYLYISEKRRLEEHRADKFDLLTRVKTAANGENTGVTLSIGVGLGGETLRECDEFARAALDMALGRGGDQAALKNKGTYEFFGGHSRGVETRTRVRSRIIASTLRALVEESDSVLIMGHAYSDLDCLGAAIGVRSIAACLGKEAKIVLEPTKTLAKALLDRYLAHGGSTVTPSAALPGITRKTLLVLVDTHRAGFLESKAVYDACTTITVIDHHRKTVDYIGNAVIFYHEPSASSASEMVAELAQYMVESNRNPIGKFEAEALLSGIMLDTRNFVLRTGVRTFEASAYLRSRGADPVQVKQMFAGSMEAYREKANIVQRAHIINGCAVSLVEEAGKTVRIAASQAADELLSVEGVSASFILYPTEDNPAGKGVNISARSFGRVNVQLIMEAFGGGGHHTMAAAQLPGETLEGAKERLIEKLTEL
ncbi:MAG: DHH family phosphoesterase [Oscillospiraceae bacterium]|nr:DHH family phosphoesterase [Oscillospiraceae bacterium]